MNIKSFQKYKLCTLASLLSWVLVLAVAAQPILDAELYIPTSFTDVSVITHCGDDRMFVAERRGYIWTVLPNGKIVEKPFLNIIDKVGKGREEGIHGIAFHPNYDEEGRFFVHYTNEEGSSVLASFTALEDDFMFADSLSESILLIYNQPYEDRNGAEIAFGPDGFLYISTGDGGGDGDPFGFSQSKENFHGKILRIDVDKPAGYGIPSDNPFASKLSMALDEIWAYGLRNPSGLHFDKEYGDLWVVDRGESYMDEVNVIWSEDEFGQNLGWSCYEGTRPVRTDLICDLSKATTFPVAEHRHQNQPKKLIGGGVYRGSNFPAMNGAYIYADEVSSNFYMLQPSENGYDYTEVGTLRIQRPGCIGVAPNGDLMVASREDGMIYRLIDFCQAYQPYLFNMQEDIIQFRLESGFWNDDFSVEWYKDGWMIDGVKDSILMVTESDNYNVSIIHERGCIMYSNELQVQLRGASINWQELIQIWPNPFTTSFTLESMAEWELDAIIVDSDGRKVDAQVIAPNSRFSWHVNLPKGLYTVQLVAPGGHQHALQVIRK